MTAVLNLKKPDEKDDMGFNKTFHQTRCAVSPPQSKIINGKVRVKIWSCNVLGCGGGKCVHELLDEECPHCGFKMVRVATTGFKFCSNHELICEFEIDPSK